MLDSGASCHLSSNSSCFANLQHFHKEICLPDGSKVTVTAKGPVNISLANGGSILLTEVYYVPDLALNLLSVSALTAKGCQTRFFQDHAEISKGKDGVIATAVCENGIYVLQGTAFPAVAAADSVFENRKTPNWHQILCHPSTYTTKKTLELCGIQAPIENKVCEQCMRAKTVKMDHSSERGIVAKAAYERIHSDIMGPFPVDSFGGSRYVITFLDDFTCASYLHFARSKSEVEEAFRSFCQFIQPSKVHFFRSDNGGEYCSKPMESFLSSHGILHEKSIPNSPSQNGASERLNRTLMEKTRAVLNTDPPSLTDLHVFGSLCYVKNTADKKKKFDDRNFSARFLSFVAGVKGFKVQLLHNGRITISNEIKFVDTVDELEQGVVSIPAVPAPVIVQNAPAVNEPEVGGQVGENVVVAEQPIDDVDEVPKLPDLEDDDVTDEPQLRRSSRVTKQPERLIDQILPTRFFGYSAQVVQGVEPVSVDEAYGQPEWRKAMLEEITALRDLKTWEIVQRDSVAAQFKPVPSKWVFKAKKDEFGNIYRYKARLVARGDLQSSWDETYSPVAKLTTFRTMVSLSAIHILRLFQMDVNNAYLHGDAPPDTFMELPKYFDELLPEERKDPGEVVLKLSK